MIFLIVLGKLLSIPLIILTAFVAFIAHAAVILAGIVLIPLLLLVGGYDIYFFLTMQWQHVFLTTLIGGGLFAIYFGASFLAALLEMARDGLIRFLRS